MNFVLLWFTGTKRAVVPLYIALNLSLLKKVVWEMKCLLMSTQKHILQYLKKSVMERICILDLIQMFWDQKLQLHAHSFLVLSEFRMVWLILMTSRVLFLLVLAKGWSQILTQLLESTFRKKYVKVQAASLTGSILPILGMRMEDDQVTHYMTREPCTFHLMHWRKCPHLKGSIGVSNVNIWMLSSFLKWYLPIKSTIMWSLF